MFFQNCIDNTCLSHLDCKCDDIGSENNTCNKGNGTCLFCKTGFDGAKCEECATNFGPGTMICEDKWKTKKCKKNKNKCDKQNIIINCMKTCGKCEQSNIGKCTQCIEGYYGAGCDLGNNVQH